MSNNKETRHFLGTIGIEKREDGTESRTISGRAVVFDIWSDAGGWFKERVSPRAFDGVDMSNVIATFNHDMNNIMARTTNTLELEINDSGLDYRFEAPNTTAGNDLLVNIKNGNVTGSSFMFTVDKDEWVEREGETPERTIAKVGRLFELGPVTVPFYPTTTAQTNSLVIDSAEARSIFEAKHPDNTKLSIEYFKTI